MARVFPLKIRKVGYIGDIGHVVYAHCSFLLLKLVGHTDQVGHADQIFTQILFFPSANCFHLSLFCPIRSLIWKDYSKFPQKSTFRGHVLIWISNWCLRCYLPRVDLFGNRAILIIDIKIPFDCKLGRASKFDFFLEKMKKRQRSHRCYSHFRWCFVMTIIHFKIKLQAGHQINIVYMHDYWINITCANMDSKDPLIAIPGHRLIHLLNPIGQDLALGLSQGCCRQPPGGQQMFFLSSLPSLPLSPGSPLTESGKRGAAFDWLHCYRTRSAPLKTFSPKRFCYTLPRAKTSVLTKNICSCNKKFLQLDRIHLCQLFRRQASLLSAHFIEIPGFNRFSQNLQLILNLLSHNLSPFFSLANWSPTMQRVVGPT